MSRISGKHEQPKPEAKQPKKMVESGVGRIAAIRGLVVEVEFSSPLPALHSILADTKQNNLRFLMLSHQSEHVAVALFLGSSGELRFGGEVKILSESFQVPVGAQTLGRVFNALGETIDDKPQPNSTTKVDVESYQRSEKDTTENTSIVIETGIKVIDFFAPFARGRKIGIIGGAGVGKTVLVTEMMHNVSKAGSGVSFFVGIGERIREAHELYATLQTQNLLANTVMYLGQMNESAAMRSIVGQSAAAAARWWRDAQHKDVLFFVDNIYRFLQAGNELSTMLGQTPSEGGYQPTLFTELSRFEEGLDSNQNGSITSVQSIYIPADDTSDPAVVEIYEQLDSVIVLSRDLMEQGILPAVDLAATSSSLLTAEIVGERHFLLANKAAEVIEKYASLRNIVAIIGESELSLQDRADYKKAQNLIEYFTQPLFVTQQLTGTEGKYVSREDMLAGVEEILAGG